MKLLYPACFYPCEEKNGYTVIVPDLPGCVSEGDTLSDSIAMASDAAAGWVLDEIEDGNPIPASSNIHDVKLNCNNGFVSLIVLDMDAYAQKHGTKAVKKTLTIPAYMNTFGESHCLNFSQLLQDAISTQMKKIGQK